MTREARIPLPVAPRGAMLVFLAVLLAAGTTFAGQIRIEIEHQAEVECVYAIDRKAPGWPKPRYAAKREEKAWIVDGLDEGLYDILIETARGSVEGANLKLTNAIGEVEPADEDAAGLTEKDRKAIRDYVGKMKIWENKRRILALEGHHKRARVLVEKLMTKKTSLPSPGPQVFWRVEVWDFENRYGGWARRRGYVVLERERLTVKEWNRLRFRFDPALGGIRVSDAEPAVVHYKLAQEWPDDEWKTKPGQTSRPANPELE